LQPLWLTKLGFTPIELGWVCAAQSLATLAAPLAGQVADRWIAAERCLSVCAFACGCLLWTLADLTTFPAVFAISLAYWMVMVPTLTLGTSLSFTHLAAPENDYGRIRLWGTLGWVAAVWLLSFWFDVADWVHDFLAWPLSDHPAAHLADIFRLAA